MARLHADLEEWKGGRPDCFQLSGLGWGSPQYTVASLTYLLLQYTGRFVLVVSAFGEK